MFSGSRETRAKLNLSLHITGVRSNGYHELESIVAFADIGDLISVAPDDSLTLSTAGPFASSLTVTKDNLVLQAAYLLQKKAKIKQGAHLALEKHLPVASGIGGGSGDAAATLLLLRDFWKIDVNDHALHEIALALGADIPMCLYGRSAIVRGIGEQMEMIDLPRWHVLLANPLEPLSTAEIFRDYAAAKTAFDIPSTASEGDWLTRLKASRNALQQVAIKRLPVIGELIKSIAATENCLLARMSGSGATCFGLYESEAACLAAGKQLSRSYPDFWLRTGVLTA